MSCSDETLGSAGSLYRHRKVLRCVIAPRWTGLRTWQCAGYLQLRETKWRENGETS
jgi:hypothetical protein